MLKDYTDDTICVVYSELESKFEGCRYFVVRKRTSGSACCCGGNMAYFEVFGASDNEKEVAELYSSLINMGYSNIEKLSI